MKTQPPKIHYITGLSFAAVLLLAGFITIPGESEIVKRNVTLPDKFEYLGIKDTILLKIRRTSEFRKEAETTIAYYDQRTDFRNFRRTQTVRQLLREEKELLKETLAVWQNSTSWKTDSLLIIKNLAKHEKMSSSIENTMISLK